MHILVTGATGLIGGEVCARLMHRGHRVTALVHHDFHVRDNARRPVAGVALLHGDVAKPLFGLARPPMVDLVIHSAAVTAFDATPETYRAINIDGTAHAIATARAAGAALLQVSTAYVCGTRDGAVTEGMVGSTFVNGYEASKAGAETLVRDGGVPFAIARPSIVVGDSVTGAISRFENIYMIFKLIAQRRLRTLPGAAAASLDLVPIDHVAGGIVAMAEDFARVAGKTLHLVAATPTPLAALGAAIAAIPGLGAPSFVDPAAFDPARLPPAERRWHAAAAGLYTAYLLRSPCFDTANAAALVPACPPTGRDWLDRLIGFCLAEGFVSARRDTDGQALSA